MNKIWEVRISGKSKSGFNIELHDKFADFALNLEKSLTKQINSDSLLKKLRRKHQMNQSLHLRRDMYMYDYDRRICL